MHSSKLLLSLLPWIQGLRVRVPGPSFQILHWAVARQMPAAHLDPTISAPAPEHLTANNNLHNQQEAGTSRSSRTG